MYTENKTAKAVVTDASSAGMGHNSGDLQMQVELRMFNRVFADFGDGKVKHPVTLPVGTSVGEVLAQYSIPESEVFIAFVNGTDITTEPGRVHLSYELQEGDRLALSGPVPYSWGYGAPIV